jgi:hypothetical protein
MGMMGVKGKVWYGGPDNNRSTIFITRETGNFSCRRFFGYLQLDLESI